MNRKVGDSTAQEYRQTSCGGEFLCLPRFVRELSHSSAQLCVPNPAGAAILSNRVTRQLARPGGSHMQKINKASRLTFSKCVEMSSTTTGRKNFPSCSNTRR